MNKKQRIALQRQKVREAIGILEGVAELFGVEDQADAQAVDDYDLWMEQISAFENWVFDESPTA